MEFANTTKLAQLEEAVRESERRVQELKDLIDLDTNISEFILDKDKPLDQRGLVYKVNPDELPNQCDQPSQ